jgi:predicted  nucleic acid-binding Zn-ribbon protein
MAGSIRHALCLAAGAALLSGNGCERESASAQALNQARHELVALHAGAVSPQDPEIRRTHYEKTIDALEKVSSEGTSQEQEAASLLLGTTHATLAQLTASETLDLEQDVISELGLVRAEFDHLVVSMQHSAKSLTSVDSTNQQRAIEADKQELRAALARANQSVQAVESQLADLRNESQTAKAGSGELRVQEGKLRTQLIQVTGQQRADLTIAAVETQRHADELDLQAAKAESQIAVLEPQLGQLQHEATQIQTQLSNISQTQQQIRAADDIRQESATEALRIAQDSSSRISQTIVELDTTRTTQIANAYDQTLAHFDAALSALRRAGRDSSTQLTIGSIHQSKAEFLQRRAAGLAQYAEVLDLLADPAIGIPNASLIQQYASRVRNNLSQVLDDAQDSLGQAIDTYRGVRVQGELRTKLNRLVEQLEAQREPESS